MLMMMLVLDNPDNLYAVLQAWENAGIGGVTILESTGLQRVKRKFIPMRYVDALTSQEESHLTLLAMVPDETRVQVALAAAESVVGDLDDANTGVFAAWPLSLVKGVPAEGG
jgi:hypothetical protein